MPPLRKAIENQLQLGPTPLNTLLPILLKSTRFIQIFYGWYWFVRECHGADYRCQTLKKDVRNFIWASFSQYVKLQSDFRYYLKLGENANGLTDIVLICLLLATPSISRTKPFFIGGSIVSGHSVPNCWTWYLLRTWYPNTERFTADQAGDIKLDWIQSIASVS